MLKFSSFVFDMEQQVLYQEHKPVSLNPRQAQILTLLLSNPHKIFSKNDILDQVWDSRVVSEQVVFQNISYIRSLIGSDAIKTFPKKGYQWQLPLGSVEAVGTLPNNSPQNSAAAEFSLSDEHLAAKETMQEFKAAEQISPAGINHTKWFAFTALLVAAVLGITFLQPKENQEELIQDNTGITSQEIVFIPFANPYSTNGHGQLADINNVLSGQLTSLQSANEKKSAGGNRSNVASFFNSPFIYRQSLALADSQLVLSGYLHHQRNDEHGQMLLLEYLVQGKKRHWQGYIQAISVSELVSKLQTQISTLWQSQYFMLTAEAFIASELSLLHSQSPEDLDTLRHLIDAQLRGQQYQVAGRKLICFCP